MRDRIESMILYSLIANEDYTRKVLPFLKEEYFSEKHERTIFCTVNSFILKYNNLPTKEAIIISLNSDPKIKEEEYKELCEYIAHDIADKIEKVPDQQWLLDKTEEWCKDKAIYNAILSSIQIIDDKNSKQEKGTIPKLLSDALAVGFNVDLGHDYLEDVDKQFDFYHRVERKIPFDIKLLNDITDGGLPNKTLTVIVAGTGCHTKGTKVLMYDGTSKNVEDIVSGDLLADPGGKIKTVKSLIRGHGKIYNITARTTDEVFEVNEHHILSLRKSSTNKKYNENRGDFVNISVEDYLKKSQHWKAEHKLYYNLNAINFKENAKLTIDPYFLGLYLGDGDTRRIEITTIDSEIVDEIYKQAKIFNCKVRVNNLKHTLAKHYYITTGVSKIENPVAKEFAKYGLYFTQTEYRTKSANKFIPHEYKISSVDNRLKVLAGLIDSDGCLVRSTSYRVTNRSEKLIEDIMVIARSLGFYCKKSVRTNKENKKIYYTMICGTSRSPVIPVRILRKKRKIRSKYTKDMCNTGFKIEYKNEDDFYGFELDGDGLYLLDNFIVTHNSGKSLFLCHSSAAWLSMGKNVLYISLEMERHSVATRIDANLLNIRKRELKNIPKDVYDKRTSALRNKTNGKLVIEDFPTSSVHVGHFRNLVNELKLKKNFKPDVIVIDYVNIMLSSRIKMGSASASLYTYVKAIVEEVRGLAMELDIPILTASQLNRSAQSDTDVDFEGIADSHGTSMTADIILALISTEELEKMDQIIIKQIKNRDNDAVKFKRFVVGIAKDYMRLYDVEQSAQKNISGSGQEEDVPAFDKTGFGSQMKKRKDFSNIKVDDDDMF